MIARRRRNLQGSFFYTFCLVLQVDSFLRVENFTEAHANALGFVCRSNFTSQLLIQMVNMYISEFTQQEDCRNKRMTKHLCVQNNTGLLLVCFVVILT